MYSFVNSKVYVEYKIKIELKFVYYDVDWWIKVLTFTIQLITMKYISTQCGDTVFTAIFFGVWVVLSQCANASRKKVYYRITSCATFENILLYDYNFTRIIPSSFYSQPKIWAHENSPLVFLVWLCHCVHGLKSYDIISNYGCPRHMLNAMSNLWLFKTKYCILLIINLIIYKNN